MAHKGQRFDRITDELFGFDAYRDKRDRTAMLNTSLNKLGKSNNSEPPSPIRFELGRWFRNNKRPISRAKVSIQSNDS